MVVYRCLRRAGPTKILDGYGTPSVHHCSTKCRGMGEGSHQPCSHQHYSPTTRDPTPSPSRSRPPSTEPCRWHFSSWHLASKPGWSLTECTRILCTFHHLRSGFSTLQRTGRRPPSFCFLVPPTWYSRDRVSMILLGSRPGFNEYWVSGSIAVIGCAPVPLPSGSCNRARKVGNPTTDHQIIGPSHVRHRYLSDQGPG